MKTFQKSQIIGISWSFVSALLWASVYVLSRFLMRGELKVDPITLSSIRFTGGFVVLLLFGLCFNRTAMFSFSRRQYLYCGVISLFSMTGMSCFLFWGQRYTSAINSSMIMSASPVLIMLLGTFIGEKLTWTKLICMTISTFGCLMVINIITADGLNISSGGWGDLIVLAAALCWATGAVIAKKLLTKCDELAVTTWAMGFAAMTLFVIELFRIDQIIFPHSGDVWLWIAYLAIFPTAIGFYAWNAALKLIDLTIVNSMQYLTPVMTVGAAFLLLNEKLDFMMLIGIVLVLGGVIYNSQNELKKR